MRKAREAKGLGVSEMARLLVRTRSTIRNYESDATKPPRAIIARWADLCDVPVDWLDENYRVSGLEGLSTPVEQGILFDQRDQPTIDFSNVTLLRKAS